MANYSSNFCRLYHAPNKKALDFLAIDIMIFKFLEGKNSWIDSTSSIWIKKSGRRGGKRVGFSLYIVSPGHKISLKSLNEEVGW